MTGLSILRASEVSKVFETRRGFARTKRKVRAVDRVSLDVRRGETLALVGESGCGKSTFGRCLLRLYELSAGRIVFDEIDISTMGMGAMRPIRRSMQMIFQDPQASLNPRRRVGELIAEPFRLHERLTETELRDRVADLVGLVGLRQDQMERFPHEFSGGQRQRIGIARALATRPKLIIADEPVSALDVSIQAQIVNLMMDLQERLGLTYVFISHDLNIVRQIANRVAVMYLGGIVELAPTEELIAESAHPYTNALIGAVPRPAAQIGSGPSRIRLSGDLPSPANPPKGCKFHTRCPRAQKRCTLEEPSLRALTPDRQVACHFPLI